MADPPPLLEIRNLTRRRAGATALDRVSAIVERGEIVGLMGGSGAGKSTLLHTLAGMSPGNTEPQPAPPGNAEPQLGLPGTAEPQLGPNGRSPSSPSKHTVDAYPPPAARRLPTAARSGSIHWHGRDITRVSPHAAASLGIQLVPQEPALPDAWTVAEAVSLGHEPVRFGCLLDRPAMARRAREWLDRLGMPLDPSTPILSLTASQRQMVAIARALAAEPHLLLLDSPTGPLRPQDTDCLFEILGDLQARGTAIVYVSDRLGEIEALATRLIVLRDGRIGGELERADINRESVHRLLAGDTLDLPIKELIEPGLELLRVTSLRTTRFPSAEASFTVREGEVVGMAGLVGAGRTEILRALIGLDHPPGGSVVVNDIPLPRGRPAAALAAGAVFIPGDMAGDSPASQITLCDAIALASLPRLSVAGVVSEVALTRLAAIMNDHLSITEGPLDPPLAQLTPSQRRKATIACALARQPKVALFDDPTRGVTMTTRAEIYESMERLAERGAAVLFASNEIDELLRIADRLLVFRHGSLAGSLTRNDDFTERGIMRLAAE